MPSYSAEAEGVAAALTPQALRVGSPTEWLLATPIYLIG